MTEPVSICLPVLNGREFLEPRMESILGQTFEDWELIVCDSYSDDGTWEYLQQFAGDPRVRLHQVPREGLYAGWNECLARVTGEYVYFATADDTMEPTLLERMVGALSIDATCELAFCRFASIDRQGNRRARPANDDFWRLASAGATDEGRLPGVSAFLIQCGTGVPIWITMTACLFRKSLMDRTGVFSTDLGSVADFEWALSAAVHSDFRVVPEELATFRSHDAQATSQNSAARLIWLALRATKRVLAACEGQLPSAWRDGGGRKAVLAPLRGRLLGELHRDFLKASPGDFACYFLKSLRESPAHTLRRLASGFSWGCEDAFPAAIAQVESLLDEFRGETFNRNGA